MDVVITTITTLDNPVTNTLALLTVFTPPNPSCSSRWWVSTSDENTYIQSGFDDDFYINSCLPQGQDYTVSFSPGLCPSGQTIAAATEYQVVSTGGYTPVWQGQCCQSGLTYSDGGAQDSTDIRGCVATLSTPTTVYAGTSYYITDTLTTSGVTRTTSYLDSVAFNCYDLDSCTDRTVVESGTLWAAPVIVLWNREDLMTFPAAYAESVASQVGVTLTRPSSSTLETASGTASSMPPIATGGGGRGRRRLSGGAIAGIVIGALVGVALLIAAILLCLRRRKRRQQRARGIGGGVGVGTSNESNKPMSQFAPTQSAHASQGGNLNTNSQSQSQHTPFESNTQKTLDSFPQPPPSHPQPAYQPSPTSVTMTHSPTAITTTHIYQHPQATSTPTRSPQVESFDSPGAKSQKHQSGQNMGGGAHVRTSSTSSQFGVSQEEWRRFHGFKEKEVGN